MDTALRGEDLVVTRTFDAPREAVFGAWTEAEAFAAWFGPHGSRMPVCTLEPHPGGRLHFKHTFETIDDVWVAGTFEVVEAPERLVFTCHFSDPDGGRVIRPEFPDGEGRIEVRFEEVEGGWTRVTVRQSGLASDQGESEGWLEGFERLAVALEGRAGGTGATAFAYPPDAPLMITRQVFDAPRQLVWEAMTRSEHMRAWWGPRDHVNREFESDVRPGGAWRALQVDPAGREHHFSGEFLEVAAPERLVLTFTYGGAPDAEPIVETHTLTEVDGRTLYVGSSRFGSMADRAAIGGAGMEWGAAQAMDRLAEILDAEAAGNDDRELVLSRVFDAPPEIVWQAWSSAEHLDRWMGPRGFVTQTESLDFRVGGEWRYTMTAPDGTVYPNRIAYEVLEPPHRLAYAHDTGEEGDPHGFQVEVTMEPVDEGRTRMRMRMRLSSKQARDFTVGFGAVELGHQTLAKLAAWVADAVPAAVR